MTDLTAFEVDLDTERPNPYDNTKVLRGDAPRTAFTKYNDALTALHEVIRHIGPAAPSPITPWMLWLDTGVSPPVERQRNSDNTAWTVKDAGTFSFGSEENVGIGITPDETYKLHVASIGSNQVASQGTTDASFITNVDGTQALYLHSTSAMSEINELRNKPLRVTVNGAIRASYMPDGSYLIGRTTRVSGGAIEVSGNIVLQPSGVTPTLGSNGDMSFHAVSDTQLRILFRGSDGITRSTLLELTP